MKRLFLAIPFPGELTEQVQNFIEPYKTHPTLKDAKWVPPENFHLTTLFLGEVPDSLIPEVQSFARGVCAKIPKFIMQPKRVTLYPETGKAKIVWLKFERSLEFQELCKELLLFLQHTLPDLEIKESIAHLTLARLRKTVDPNLLSFKAIDFTGFEVDATGLYESTLSPQGSSYALIEQYPHLG